MKIAFRLLLVAALSISLAMLLSWVPNLPDLDRHIRGGEEAVTQQEPVKLTEENLVDHLVRMPFRQNLARVNWNGSRLAVDFRTDGKAYFPSEIFNDLFLLCQFGFSQTTNVAEITVRIIDRDRDEKRESWLLALHASRSRWQVVEAEKVRRKEQEARVFMEKYFQVQYSADWPYGKTL